MREELDFTRMRITNLANAIERERVRRKDGGFERMATNMLPSLRSVMGGRRRVICERRTLKGHIGKIYSLHWAGDSTRLVSASQDGMLIVWDCVRAEQWMSVSLRSAWVMCATFEQSRGEQIASGGLDDIVSIYNAKQQTQGMVGAVGMRAAIELCGHNSYIAASRFLDPHRIVTASGDGTIMQWDVESGTSTRSWSEHDADVMSLDVRPKDENVFASCSCDRSIRVWDVRMQQDHAVASLTVFPSDVNNVRWFPDSEALGAAGDDRSCRLVDIRCMNELNRYFDANKCAATASSCAFSSSGRLLFAGYDDTYIHGWDAVSPENKIHVSLSNHESRITEVGVAPSGQALASCSWDTTVKVYV